MALPVVPLDTDTVEIGGSPIEIRSLSREEVTRLASFDADTDAAESYMISCGTGVTVDDAAEWRRKVSAPTASALLDAIAVLSGLRAVKGPRGN